MSKRFTEAEKWCYKCKISEPVLVPKEENKMQHREKTIKCPKCKVNMKKLTNGKHVIDKCPKCEGVFLDKAEINSIKKQGFFQYVRNYWRKE